MIRSLGGDRAPPSRPALSIAPQPGGARPREIAGGSIGAGDWLASRCWRWSPVASC